MYNFCTLFDSYYLSRGLALYNSLEKHASSFHLYIFAFDDASYKLLINKKLKDATIISLKEFENERLLSVKDSRSKGEYCWTSTGSTIKYCIERYNLDSCTYLDADLYFYADPAILLKEVEDGSTLITEHRYTKKYDKSQTSGKYCVQFMTFHNNEESMKVLNSWIDSCIDWCYAKAEDGKFGDQKYLDTWRDDFKKIHELEHLGGGVAPWNVQQYNFKLIDNKVIGVEKSSGKEFELVFYHFHALKFLKDDFFELSVYELSKKTIDIIYKPYMQEIFKLNQELGEEFLVEQEPLSKRTYTLKFIIKRVIEDWKSPFLAIYNRIFDKKHIYHKSYFQ